MENSKESVSNYITELIKSLPKDEKADMAEFISVQATIMGSYNTYEGVGILDVAKTEYLRLCEEEYFSRQDECDGCDECNLRKN